MGMCICKCKDESNAHAKEEESLHVVKLLLDVILVGNRLGYGDSGDMVGGVGGGEDGVDFGESGRWSEHSSVERTHHDMWLR